MAAAAETTEQMFEMTPRKADISTNTMRTKATKMTDDDSDCDEFESYQGIKFIRDNAAGI